MQVCIFALIRHDAWNHWSVANRLGPKPDMETNLFKGMNRRDEPIFR